MVKASQSATDFRISVIDQGPGISPSDLPYIFERFVRINRSIEGSGLGLAIARTIAEAHHGELSVESVVGRGSAFTLTLPREPQP